MVETDINKTLHKWDKEFWIVTTIKCKRNDQNEEVIDSFKKFCELETDNDYTQGLKRLLEHYQASFLFE